MNHEIENPFEVLSKQLNRIESMLVALKEKQEKVVPENNVKSSNGSEDISILMAMRVTGYKKKTIYNLVNKRLIPHSKKGNKLYFDAQELREWIKEGKRYTIEELSR